MHNFIFIYNLIFFSTPLQFYVFNILNTADIGFRTNFNEFFFNFYNIFWTNIWYVLIISLFFNCLLLIILKPKIYYLITYVVILNLYLLEFSSFYCVSMQINLFNNYTFITNFLLLNTLNKYHPFLFYFVTSFLFLIILKKINNINHVFYYTSIKIINLYKYSLLIIFLITLFLFLGSWWAVQEGSWGGWWAWDSSENFGLLLIFLIILFFHFFLNFIIFFYIKNWLVIYLYICIIFYNLLQINYTNTSHNFGIKFFYFFNTNWFLLETAFCIFVFSIHYVLFNIYSIYKFNIFQNYHFYNYYFFTKKTTYIFLTLFMLILIMDFKSLLNFILINTPTINTLTLLNLYSAISFIFVSVMLIYFFQITFFYIGINFIFLLNLNYFFIYLKYFTSSFLINYLHYLFCLISFLVCATTVFNFVFETSTNYLLNHSFKYDFWNFYNINNDLYYLFYNYYHINYFLLLFNEFLVYILQNINFVKIFYVETLCLTKSIYFFNGFLNKIFFTHEEYFNELIIILNFIIFFKFTKITINKNK